MKSNHDKRLSNANNGSSESVNTIYERVKANLERLNVKSIRETNQLLADLTRTHYKNLKRRTKH